MDNDIERDEYRAELTRIRADFDAVLMLTETPDEVTPAVAKLIGLDPEFAYDDDDIRDIACNWLSDVLEIRGIWEGSSRREASFRGCKVIVTTGGPQYELDTARRVWRAFGWFGAGLVELSASDDICAHYDDMIGEGE